MIRAILIDPFARSVSEHMIPDHTDGSAQWAAMKEVMQCQYLERVPLGESPEGEWVVMYCDEEGLLNKPWEEQAFFVLRSPADRPPGYVNNPLAGRCLVLTDEDAGEGEDCETIIAGTKAPLDFFHFVVRWLDPGQVVARMPTFTTLDENLNPVGEPEVLGVGPDGETTWDIHNQPR